MPSATAILWATAVGLIAVLGAIIAYLVNKGFNTIKASIEREFKVLWDKLNEFQKAYNGTAASLLAHKEAEQVRNDACLERHRKMEEEIANLNRRIEDRRHHESEL